MNKAKSLSLKIILCNFLETKMADYEILDFVLVKGAATRAIKEELKGMGALWSVKFTGWFVPAENLEEVEELLKNARPLTKKEKTRDDNMEAFRKEVAARGGKKIDHLELVDYSEDSFVVYGKTTPHKDNLKDMKGTWNRSLGGYIFAVSHRKKVQEYVDTVNEAGEGDE